MSNKKITAIIIALAVLVGLVVAVLFGTAGATKQEEPKKVFVCKYVGTPNVDERLQTGQNPISVSIKAIKDYEGVGSSFADKQGRSYVVALDTGQAEPACPSGGTVTPVIIDQCPNIDGVQASVPEGFELVDGKCVEVIPEVDVCENIDGVQTTIPAGYNWDDNVCTKIEGTPLPPEAIDPVTQQPYVGK